jgi:hypothetical protein
MIQPLPGNLMAFAPTLQGIQETFFLADSLEFNGPLAR